VKKPVFFNIYSYVKSYEISEDLLQETFLELLKNTKKIKKSEDLLGYLIVISKNKALNYIKKNKRIITESDLENTETI
jgi:RNA polymerase sigma-70 factor (ECF subfamily)